MLVITNLHNNMILSTLSTGSNEFCFGILKRARPKEVYLLISEYETPFHEAFKLERMNVLTYLESAEENPCSVKTGLGDRGRQFGRKSRFSGEGVEEGGEDNERNKKDKKRGG